MSQEIRALVTKKCNYKCTFCHEEGLSQNPQAILSPDDYGFLADVSKEMGRDTITLTGGEPLFRRDIVPITREIGHSVRQTITTNGMLLDSRMNIGDNISKLNVSLHTMNPMTYREITGIDSLERVKANLTEFGQRYPQVNIVLNGTLVRDVNADEKSINQLASFASMIGANIKFVELYPKGCDGFVDNQDSAKLLESIGFKLDVEAPRKVNFIRDGLRIALTRILCSQARLEPNPGVYCAETNDLFLSPDGIIQTCREKAGDIDILQGIKQRDTSAVKTQIQKAFDNIGNNCIY